jgi:hypothetical protein
MFADETTLLSPRQRFWLVLGAAGLLILLLAGGTLLLRLWQGDPIAAAASADGQEAASPFVTPEPELHLDGLSESEAARRILRRHETALAGRQGMQALVSLRIEGWIKTHDAAEPTAFILAKKMPDRVRLGIRRDNFSVVVAYDGTVAWRGIEQGVDWFEVEQVPLSMVAQMVRHAPLHSELFLAQPRGWQVRYVGQRENAGRRCFVLRVDGMPDESIEFHIDAASMLDVLRVSRHTIDGQSVVREIHHEDFANFDGFMLPRRLRTVENGEQVQVLTIESVRINPGILNSHFSMPEP